MFVESNHSPFNSTALLEPALIIEDRESTVGRFTTWYIEQREIPVWGCLVMMVVNIAQCFFSLLCCDFAHQFSSEIAHRDRNIEMLKDWPAIKDNSIASQNRIAAVVQANFGDWDEIPELEVEDCISFRNDVMTVPVMKGVDASGHPFIMLDVISKELNVRESVPVYQLNPTGSFWWTNGAFCRYGIPTPFTEDFSDLSRGEGLLQLAKLLKGTHETYELHVKEEELPATIVWGCRDY